MPRQTNIRRNPRFNAQGNGSPSPDVQVNHQNLYLDHFRPGPRSHNAQAFASALDSFTSAMAHGERGLFKDMIEEKERKGAIAGFLGIEIDEVPDEPIDPAMQTRDKMRGKIATAQFKSALDGFYRENRDLDPLTYNVGLQNLKKEFLHGKNRSFIEGFLNDALAYEEQANFAYVEYQDAKDTEEFMNELGGMAYAELQKLTSDPRYADYMDAGSMAEVLHQFTLNAQDLGKTYKGISRDVVNQKVIETIGIMAVREGRPDWMDFALQKDVNGIALWDTSNKGMIAGYIRQAENQRDALAKEHVEAQKLARKEMEAEAYRTMVDAVYSEDPKVKEQASLYLVQNREMFTGEKYEHLTGILNELRTADKSFFNQDSDENVLTELLVAADDNKLELSKLRQAKKYLTRDDYLKVFERVSKAHEQAIKDAKSKGKGKSPMDVAITDVKSSLKNELLYGGGIMEKKNPFGTDTTRKRQRWGLRYFAQFLEYRQAERAEAKERFTYKDLDWVVAKAKRAAYIKVLPRGDMEMVDKVAPDPDPVVKPSAAPKPAAASTAGGRPSFDDIEANLF